MSSESIIGSTQQSGAFSFDLTGQLEVVPLEPVNPKDGRARLLFSFSSVKLNGNQLQREAKERFERVARELSGQHTFTYAHGAVAEARLGRNMEALSAGILRNLAAAFQFPAAAPTGNQPAQAEEYDATGRYRVEYTANATPDTFSKRKLQYESLIMDSAVKSSMMGQVMPPRFKKSSAELARRDGVLQRSTSDELIDFEMMPGSNLTAHTKLELSLQQTHTIPAPDDAQLAAATDPIMPDVPYRTATAAFNFDATKIGGRSFAELVAVLEKLEATRPLDDPDPRKRAASKNPADDAPRSTWVADHNKALIAFSALLRSQPGRVADVLLAVRAHSPATHDLVTSLGMSGTEAAQQALLDLMRDASLSEENRNSAGFALIRTKTPAESSARALESLLDDPTWNQYAILGLGTYARLFGESGRPDEHERIGKLLIARLAAAKTDQARTDAFSALSNSGYAGMLTAIRPYLDDANEQNRRDAVEALRLVHHPEVEKLATAKLGDEAAGVRMAALTTMQSVGATVQLAKAVQSEALHDKNANVRMQALQLLVQWMPTAPEVSATIEQIAASDESQIIRETAQRALQPG